MVIHCSIAHILSDVIYIFYISDVKNPSFTDDQILQ